MLNCSQLKYIFAREIVCLSRITFVLAGHNITKGGAKKLEFWVVVMISLPVLYMTGSLRRAVMIMGISGKAFLLYFAIGIVLAMLPIVYAYRTGINVCGAYLCLSATIYAAATKRFDYRLFIAAAAALLIGVAEFVVSNSFVLPNIGYIRTAIVCIASILIYRGQAALFLPVIALVYNAAVFVVSLVLGLSHNFCLFSDMELILFGITVSLIVSYAFERTHGRHARRAHG